MKKAEGLIFTLCVLAAISAECIPVMLALVAAAGGVTIWKELSMGYYKTCRHCGGRLDPGERCDCAAAMYERLTPENRAKVDQKIEELLEKQRKAAPVLAHRDGRNEITPHDFTAHYSGFVKEMQV